MCPLCRQGAPPPAPGSAESKQGLRGLCPGGDGACPRSLREGPSKSAMPSSLQWLAGRGGCRVSVPLIAQNPRAASPWWPPAGPGTWVHCHPHPRFFLGRLCLPEPPANAQPGPPTSECSPGRPPPPRPHHRHLHLGSRQPARPWHRAQMVHTGAARTNHTVRARAGGLLTCQGHDAGSPPSVCSCLLGMWGRGRLTGGMCRGVGGAGPGTLKSSRRQDQRTFCELGDRETEGAELLAIASRGRPTSSSEADGPRGHRAQRQESPEVPAPTDPVSTPLPAPGTTCTLQGHQHQTLHPPIRVSGRRLR